MRRDVDSKGIYYKEISIFSIRLRDVAACHVLFLFSENSKKGLDEKGNL
jgi:hypothetical protein